jgi:FtsZ-interacting cell division protein ZipA
MTYAIQAIAGVVIAVAAVAVVAWRRAKKKVVQKLGLEERTKKEVEDDFSIINDEDTSSDTVEAADVAEAAETTGAENTDAENAEIK